MPLSSYKGKLKSAFKTALKVSVLASILCAAPGHTLYQYYHERKAVPSDRDGFEFHCMAFFEIARTQGPTGIAGSLPLGVAKELVDIFILGHNNLEQSTGDMKANLFGIWRALSAKTFSPKEACADFRYKGVHGPGIKR